MRPERAARPKRGLWFALDVLAVAIATYLIGRDAKAFTGFPKGYDAWGHLSKARLIAETWPHINWNDAWYAGQPAFQGSYPPGYHLIVVAISWVTGCSLATAMVVVAAAATIAIVTGVQVLVHAITRSRTAAATAAIVLLASPTLWDQTVELGLYPRLVAFGFAALAVAAAAIHRHTGTRRAAITTILLLAAALSTHPVVGALGVVLTVLVLAAGPTPAPSRRVVGAVGVPLAAAALCAYFYLPLVLIARGQSAFTDYEKPLPGWTLVWPAHGDLAALPPVLLPGTVAVAIAAWLLLRRRRHRVTALLRLGPRMPLVLTRPAPGERVPGGLPDAARRHLARHWQRSARLHRHHRGIVIALGYLVLSLLVVAYGLVGYVWPRFPLYVNGLQPRDLLIYPAWLLAAATAIGMHAVATELHRPWRRAVVRAMAVAAALACLGATAPAIAPGVRDTSGPETDAMIALLPRAAYDNHDYRIGGLDDATSRWLNAVTDTPQLRGYDDHGNLHLDWQYWLEDALTNPRWTTAQRDWLLRWWAVRWLLTDTPDGAPVPIASDPGVTRAGAEHVYANVGLWQVDDPAPLVTAVTAPTLLVVGDDAHYDAVLRALAAGGVDDRSLVPVHGPASLDGLEAAAFAPFDAVLLYGAGGDAKHAASVLGTYVRGGGGLLVEADDGVAAGLLKQPDDPLPVRRTFGTALHGQWFFGPATDPLAAGAHLAAWAPPAFGSGPWQAEAAARLAPGAHPVLEIAGSPAVVAGRLGAGTVVWSGLNLPYHAAANQSAVEAGWLGDLARYAARRGPTSGAVSARWADPQDRTIVAAPGTRGVLVREFVAPDWHATADGHAATIWPAGPDMMYVALPPHRGPVTVALRYRLGTVERAGFVGSGIALLVLVGAAIGGPLGRRRDRLVRRVLDRLAAAAGAGPLDLPPVRVAPAPEREPVTVGG